MEAPLSVWKFEVKRLLEPPFNEDEDVVIVLAVTILVEVVTGSSISGKKSLQSSSAAPAWGKAALLYWFLNCL